MARCTSWRKVVGFFHWVGISHYVNLLFVGFLMRSGLQILSAHPKLYWNDSCAPERAWVKFTRKKMPTDKLWTASDEEDPFSPWLALPGGKNLGVGRHWHLVCALGWMLNGFLYVALLFGTGGWRRLIPTSWGIVPAAGRAAWTYLHLTLPPEGDRVNGYPPTGVRYQELARTNFADWRLKVGGLVRTPLELSLADLRAMPVQTQITKHHCIQGWSSRLGRAFPLPLSSRAAARYRRRDTSSSAPSTSTLKASRTTRPSTWNSRVTLRRS